MESTKRAGFTARSWLLVVAAGLAGWLLFAAIGAGGARWAFFAGGVCALVAVVGVFGLAWRALAGR